MGRESGRVERARRLSVHVNFRKFPRLRRPHKFPKEFPEILTCPKEAIFRGCRVHTSSLPQRRAWAGRPSPQDALQRRRRSATLDVMRAQQTLQTSEVLGMKPLSTLR